jgi:hypothetical protein
VTLFNTDLVVSGAAEALDALRSGKGRGHVIELRNTQGIPFRAYIPDLITGDPNAPLTPEPLNIPGIEEHRGHLMIEQQRKSADSSPAD